MGSVIHAMSGEQDMRRMGALKDKIPITHWTMFIGSVAIAGIPGLAGFFSKDEILWQTYSSPIGSAGLYSLGPVPAGPVGVLLAAVSVMLPSSGGTDCAWSAAAALRD